MGFPWHGLGVAVALGTMLACARVAHTPAPPPFALTADTSAEAMALPLFRALQPDPSSELELTAEHIDALTPAQLEWAGVLFYAFRERAQLELAAFPPAVDGGTMGSVGAAYGAIWDRVGEELNPRLFLHPDVQARVVARIDAWQPSLAHFHPRWKYDPPQLEQAEAERVKNRILWDDQMHTALTLLADPAYFALYRAMRACNTPEECLPAFRGLWDAEQQRGADDGFAHQAFPHGRP